MVYNPLMDAAEGQHIFVHSRKDGKDGVVCLVINNCPNNTVEVDLPKAAKRYTLSAKNLRSTSVLLNGKELALQENGEFPEMVSAPHPAGITILRPATLTFFVMD